MVFVIVVSAQFLQVLDPWGKYLFSSVSYYVKLLSGLLGSHHLHSCLLSDINPIKSNGTKHFDICRNPQHFAMITT
jgi:hypothetical protein